MILRKRSYRRLSFARISDLPWDAMIQIISYLSLGDLQAMIEAKVSPGLQAQMRNLFRERRRELHVVRNLFVLQPQRRSGYRTTALRAQLSPSEMSHRLTGMTLILGPSGLPFGIGELSGLRELDIRATTRSYPLSSLPDSLSQCKRLQKLTLKGNDFTELPKVVGRLPDLRVLILDYCVRLRKLPINFGRGTPRLRLVSVIGCPGITEIPRSLLRRLEKNINKCSINPLKVSAELFPRGYLRRAIGKKRFPLLFDKCKPAIDANADTTQNAGEQQGEPEAVENVHILQE